MTKIIRQSVTIRGATPRDIYDVLTESGRHSHLIGAKARIGNSVGDPWRAYDGSLSGKQVELVPGKRIVQTWRGHDWPAGHYSTASFTLSRVTGGTRIDFRQTGVPDEHYESYRKGWTDFYWTPLKRLFSG